MTAINIKHNIALINGKIKKNNKKFVINETVFKFYHKRYF